LVDSGFDVAGSVPGRDVTAPTSATVGLGSPGLRSSRTVSRNAASGFAPATTVSVATWATASDWLPALERLMTESPLAQLPRLLRLLVVPDPMRTWTSTCTQVPVGVVAAQDGTSRVNGCVRVTHGEVQVEYW
jgi:hypothetical protein